MSWDFPRELETWGPRCEPRPAVSPADARNYCRQIAATHYENFPVVTRLLPQRLHQHFFNVYAFCRWADDLGDEVGDRDRSRELLGWWRDELRACFDGETRHPVFVALSETIAEFAISARPFEDLISAFEQDQWKSGYETFDELRDYCSRSADPVGRIVLHLFRAVDDENVRLSDSICTGLQLANFWQDVARDATIGRKYLPEEDCRRFGYTAEEYERRSSTDNFRRLLAFEVARAREFLDAGRPLVDRLPREFQFDMELFVRGGLCILRRIERLDFRVWETRPKVTRWDLCRLFAAAWCRQAGRRIGLVAPRMTAGTPARSGRVSP